MKAISTIQAKQKGFSLVELLLVLGVIALIAIAAFIIYPSVQAGTQANTESSNITAIVAGVKNLYGSKGNYGIGSPATNGDITGTVTKAHIFPSTMVGGDYSGTTAPQSVWTQPVKVAAVGAPAGSKFEIEYDGIPTEACVKFVSGVAANFDTVGSTTGGTDIKASGAAPDPAAIVTVCSAASTAKIFFDSK